MKIDKKHIELIRKQFANLKSKEDLVSLLNTAQKIIYGKKSKPIQLKTLIYYTNLIKCKNRYNTFSIKKKSGGQRIIHSPIKELKSILRYLNLILQSIYEPHRAATGFVLNKSVVDNAKKHVGHYYVFNIDIKNFFYSFDRNRVKQVFMREPFNLSSGKEPIAFMLASLCTHPIEIDNKIKIVLPQGSPTSPTITNIICKRLDKRLTGLAKRFGAVYTRYADDITFSSFHNIFKKEDNPKLSEKGCYDSFIDELYRLIKEEGLEINTDKTRLQNSNYSQEVTGLKVNDKINVRRRYVKQIRMWLYYWEKYGFEKAEKIFKRDYNADKGHLKKNNAQLINVIKGKIEFLKMVKGIEDSTYKKIKERFDMLTGIVNEPNKTLIKDGKSSISNYKNAKEYPILHNPYLTVQLLNTFSANDKDLKYTTHSWEYGKFVSYDDFIKKIQKNWKEISENLKKQNEKLHAKIFNFLFNKNLGKKNEKGYINSWGEKYLKFGWSSPELKEFCDSTKDSPFLCPIPLHIRELDKEWGFTIFDEYVNIFKNEIEFREDSNYLKKLFLDKRKKFLSYDFNIKLINLEGKSFYTDTAYVSNTIEKIFLESFKVRPEFPDIKVEIEKIENYFLLTITQLDSKVERNIDDPKIIKPTGGTLKGIIDNMKNLADFSIMSKFSDENIYRINYLVSDKNKKLLEKLNQDIYSGFTYEFKFYLL